MKKLTKKQVLDSPYIQKTLLMIYWTQCHMCAQKFERPLMDKKGWNYTFLAHLHQTHGLDPEAVIDIIHQVAKGEDKP